MKININIEVSPSELIELQDVVHEGAPDVVTKLTSKDMAHKVLEHLKETSNQEAYHIPADHIETGTVIQGKPPHGIDSTGEPEFHVGDLVELRWEGDGCDFSGRLFSITELHDDGMVSLKGFGPFSLFQVVNIPKSWISRPLRKVELCGDDEWIVPDTDSPQPTPPRPMRDPNKRIQAGTQVMIQPFTGHNEIFTVMYAGDKQAIVRGENGEFNVVDLSELLRVWPDPESTYGVYCGAIVVEPPKE